WLDGGGGGAVCHAGGMLGIVSYGVYLPFWRLDRSEITSTLGQGGGRGTRAVAGYDEDSTSLGVEAGRLALRSLAADVDAPHLLTFATTSPGYLDKTNATAVHAALRLDLSTPAFDSIGSARSGIGAAWMAQAAGGMAVLADVRTGRPGSADEAAGGDGAAAFVFGADPIAVPVGSASSTAEFVDRWRVPGEAYSRQWEDRFGEHAYLPVATEAITEALKSADVAIADIDRVVVAGLHARAVGAVRRSIGVDAERLVDDFAMVVGNTATAHWGLMLAHALDTAEAGQRILVANLADGCDVWILQVTDAILAFRERAAAAGVQTVAARLGGPSGVVDYASFLTWRGMLDREPPRRPEPDRPASPPSLRGTSWKYGFVGAQDDSGFVHLPPGRVSIGSGSIDEMTPVPMADRRAKIATFTIDRLAFSLAPPVVAAIVDFDHPDDPSGSTTLGRMQVELTDCDPDAVQIGDRVEMTFRRLYTVDGIHNYFWKARPTN
ncbi:MAG: OB-fold domain-containing protein, partial [Actinomycetota bacterium]